MSGAPSCKDSVAFQRSGSPTPCTLYEADRILPTAKENHDSVESVLQDTRSSFERKDGLHAKSYASEIDTKRAKQQFAQRSKVCKLQYIAELERNVQSLQAEGSEVSAELEFLNQQNLILSMENKELKQHLESLAQEQLIKYLEQEVLEREIGRLRCMYQQQAPMTQQSKLPPRQQLMPQIQFQPAQLQQQMSLQQQPNRLQQITQSQVSHRNTEKRNFEILRL
ncbi:unnamed protein product [Vicia faba]|uniref:BZIP domain-containing protein n=1 Tax=Vicia faba TaxID=3906 RepID=A0AAV0Z8S4_VICFA|nr:unnamed protein product [Vicia faba]